MEFQRPGPENIIVEQVSSRRRSRTIRSAACARCNEAEAGSSGSGADGAQGIQGQLTLLPSIEGVGVQPIVKKVARCPVLG